MSIPRFGFLRAGSGDVAFGRGCLLAAVVADDLVDLYDDVEQMLFGREYHQKYIDSTTVTHKKSGLP